MATVALSGKSGTATGEGMRSATEIKNWSATITVDALDATSMASAGWKESIVGLMGGTGTFVAIGTSPISGIKGQTGAASIALKTSDTGATITADAIITSCEVGVPVDGVVTYNCAFTFTGEIAIS